jgi:hypothetical protein
MCIIQYFASVINSNNLALTKKSLVGAEIPTSDLRDQGGRATNSVTPPPFSTDLAGD